MHNNLKDYDNVTIIITNLNEDNKICNLDFDINKYFMDNNKTEKNISKYIKSSIDLLYNKIDVSLLQHLIDKNVCFLLFDLIFSILSIISKSVIFMLFKL